MRREVRYLSGNKSEFNGVVGEETKMTYVDGSVTHIGDLIGIYYNGKFKSESLIVKEKYSTPYIMGLKSYNDNVRNGVLGGSNFSIQLIKKYDKLDDGRYRDGVLEVVTIKSNKSPSQKKTFHITVKVEADLAFKQPEIEDVNGEDVFIFSGRSVIYFNKLLGEYGIATCNSNELKSYNKEIGKALAYYRAHMKLAEE